ncbi:MAG: hypothetical protein ACPW61_07585 [Methyloligella sp. ZOD6]
MAVVFPAGFATALDDVLAIVLFAFAAVFVAVFAPFLAELLLALVFSGAFRCVTDACFAVAFLDAAGFEAERLAVWVFLLAAAAGPVRSLFALAVVFLADTVFAGAAVFPAVCLATVFPGAVFLAADVFTAELALVVARAEIGFRLLAGALADAALVAARLLGTARSFAISVKLYSASSGSKLTAF